MGFSTGVVRSPSTHKPSIPSLPNPHHHPPILTSPPQQTGGVTLTLGLAYLAILTHQRNRQAQSDILRAQQSVLTSLIHDPSLPRPPPTTPYAGLLTREQPDHHFVETAKSKWNEEIENAVRWAQTKDWEATRVWVEDLIFGSRPVEEVKRDVGAFGTEAAREVDMAEERGQSVLEEARSQSIALAQSAKETAAVLSDEGKAVFERGVERGREVVHAGVEKGREMVHRAEDMAHKAATEIGLAEKKLEHKVDEKVLRYNAVDRALAQRYERDGGKVMEKSVEEVLRERYRPVEAQDHTNLQGL